MRLFENARALRNVCTSSKNIFRIDNNATFTFTCGYNINSLQTLHSTYRCQFTDVVYLKSYLILWCKFLLRHMLLQTIDIFSNSTIRFSILSTASSNANNNYLTFFFFSGKLPFVVPPKFHTETTTPLKVSQLHYPLYQ